MFHDNRVIRVIIRSLIREAPIEVTQKGKDINAEVYPTESKKTKKALPLFLV